jgi:hypothetical protein
MPDIRAVSYWIANDPDLAVEYAAARRAGSLVWADDILEMSDASRGLDMAGVQSHRLSVDSRRWMLSKLRPEEFGERAVEHPHVQVVLSLPPKQGIPDPRYPGSARLIEAVPEDD